MKNHFNKKILYSALAIPFALIAQNAMAQCYYVACPNSAPMVHQNIINEPIVVDNSSYQDGYDAGIAAGSKTIVRYVNKPSAKATKKIVQKKPKTQYASKAHYTKAKSTKYVAKKAAPKKYIGEKVYQDDFARENYYSQSTNYQEQSAYQQPQYIQSAMPPMVQEQIVDNRNIGPNVIYQNAPVVQYQRTTIVRYQAPQIIEYNNGRSCGWGAPINYQSQIQLPAAYVCSCPEGWRPL
jgi:hypothetical protein